MKHLNKILNNSFLLVFVLLHSYPTVGQQKKNTFILTKFGVEFGIDNKCDFILNKTDSIQTGNHDEIKIVWTYQDDNKSIEVIYRTSEANDLYYPKLSSHDIYLLLLDWQSIVISENKLLDNFIKSEITFVNEKIKLYSLIKFKNYTSIAFFYKNKVVICNVRGIDVNYLNQLDDH